METLNGKPVNESPLCGPYSVSVISGVSLEKVMKDWRKMFNRGPRWKGRSFLSECTKMLEHYGFMPKPVEYKGPLMRFVKEVARAGEVYCIRVGGHFLTVSDGVAIDQSQWGELETHWCKRKRVTDAFEVIKKGV